MSQDQFRIRCAPAELIVGTVNEYHVEQAMMFLTALEFELFTLKSVLGQTNKEIADRFETSVPTVVRRWQDIRYLVAAYTNFCVNTKPQQTLNEVSELFRNDGNVLLGVFKGFSKAQIHTATGVGVRQVMGIVKWHVDLNLYTPGALGHFFQTLGRVAGVGRLYDQQQTARH